MIRRVIYFPKILYRAGTRLYWDDGFARAAGLAYTTLLALVPLVALSISLLPGFGIGQRQALRAVKDILDRLLPAQENELVSEMQHQIFSVFTALSGNVSELNALSIVVLAGTTIALFLTIQGALNRIWRVIPENSFVSRILNFWGVITLGLILIAVSVVLSTKLNLLAHKNDLEHSTWLGTFKFILPIFLTWTALSLLYNRVPSTKVRVRDAILGGMIAALLFEVLKVAFAYYVGLSTNYSTFYGVLASIPLFLFWLYLLWVVVLFGAEVSYQAGALHLINSLKRYNTELGEAGIFLGLKLLCLIAEEFVKGDLPPSEGELSVNSGAGPEIVRTTLDILTKAEMISAPDDDCRRRTLLISPNKLTLGEIISAFVRLPSSNIEQAKGKQVLNNDQDIRKVAALFERICKTNLQLVERPSLANWTLADLVMCNKDSNNIIEGT